MTKKHFQALADALKEEMPGTHLSAMALGQWVKDIQSIANACAQFDVNFNREKFLLACGLTLSEL